MPDYFKRQKKQIMIIHKTLYFLLLCAFPLCRVEGHVFRLYAGTNEEMKDRICINVNSDRITINYESEYHGQIAPHIRFMADSSRDSILTREEVTNFVASYKAAFAECTQNYPILFDGIPYFFKLIVLQAPTIIADDFVDPLKIKMMFAANNLNITQGEHELTIDPRMLFLNGNQFIRMARDSAGFTDEQEKIIARFLQVKIFASEKISFLSSQPGYIKQNKKMIYGLFFDETILRIQFLAYPKIQIKLQFLSEVSAKTDK